MGRVARIVLCVIVIGVVIQSVINTPLLINVGLCIGMLLLSLWRDWCLYVALVFLSATNTVLHTSVPIAAPAREAVFSGTVISEQPYETYVQLLLHIDHVRIGNRTMQFGETVLFYAQTDETCLGRHLLVRGRIKNARYGRRPHVLSGRIIATTPTASIIGGIQSAVNQFIHHVLGAVLAPVHADIAASLILGGSGRVGRDVRDAFSRAGVLHILAVSGLHVGFVAVFVGLLLLFVPLSLRMKFMLTMLVLLLYAAVTGFRPSVCRATVMAFLFGFAVLIQRNVKPLHIVNITAIAFLIVNPFALFNLSTQLSFAAVYGIVILFPLCNEKVVRHVHNRFVRRILTIMAISFSAQAFVSPLLAYYFHRLPTCAIISNCVIVPLVSVAVFLLFLCLGVGALSLVGAHLVAFLVSIILDAVTAISSVFANLPFSTITLYISPVLFAPFYLLFFRSTRKTAIFMLICILILASLGALPQYTMIIQSSNTTSITTHDNSTVVVTREKKNGNVQAFLERHHIREIDCLVAPQGCRLSAERFCRLPDVLHVKRIGVGSLNFEIGNDVLMRYGMLQIPLLSDDAYDSLNEPRVTYTITDGARAYRFHAPQYGSVIDQMLVDVRLVCGKILFLF